MVQVKIRTGRGTGTIKVDIEDLKFSGLEFKLLQAERKKQAGNVNISTGRGTGTRKLQDTPNPSSKPEPKRISSGRGTKTTKL